MFQRTLDILIWFALAVLLLLWCYLMTQPGLVGGL